MSELNCKKACRRLNLVILAGFLVLALSVSAWAGMNKSNDYGSYDGKYTAKLIYPDSKKTVEDIPAEINGLFLTLHMPEGDRVLKVSDFYDRYVELEVQCYDSESGHYITCKLDDGGSHSLFRGSSDEKNKATSKNGNSSTVGASNAKQSKEQKVSGKNDKVAASSSDTAVNDSAHKGSATKQSSDKKSANKKGTSSKDKKSAQKGNFFPGVAAPASGDGDLPSFYGR